MVFVDVRRDVFIACQKGFGLVINPSTTLKYFDVMRSNPSIPHVRGEGWVDDTRFDDVVPW